MNLRKVAGLVGALVVSLGIGLAGPAQAADKAPAPLAAGVVNLVNNVSGKCVEVKDASKSNGARIQQWTCGSDSHRRWIANDLGNGYVQYANVNSGRCLQAIWGTISVTQTDCNASDQSQWWRWAPANNLGDQWLVNPTPWGDSCLALIPFSWLNGRIIGLADCGPTNSAHLWHSVSV
ncbi:RICIN domain-containing protein [Actinoplanes sp. NPDC026670]|uniref:RICIN domain-containing protein n=1 Tax=Actinoplanes sp. NPDC026670 TaxID=3154700 RepID=UPI0033EA4679